MGSIPITCYFFVLIYFLLSTGENPYKILATESQHVENNRSPLRKIAVNFVSKWTRMDTSGHGNIPSVGVLFSTYQKRRAAIRALPFLHPYFDLSSKYTVRVLAVEAILVTDLSGTESVRPRSVFRIGAVSVDNDLVIPKDGALNVMNSLPFLLIRADEFQLLLYILGYRFLGDRPSGSEVFPCVSHIVQDSA